MKPRIVLAQVSTVLLVAAFAGLLFAAPPAPPPSPLTSVTHDATLTGNGTAASPLGVVPRTPLPLSWSVEMEGSFDIDPAGFNDILTLSLPAGSYVATAAVVFVYAGPHPDSVSCYSHRSGTAPRFSKFSSIALIPDTANVGSMPVLASFTLTAPASVSVTCGSNSPGFRVPQAALIAIQVSPQ